MTLMVTLGARPRGMTPFAARVFDTLAWHVMSPWSVMKSAAGKYDCDPSSIDPLQLASMINAMERLISVVTDDENGEKARAALRRLVPSSSVGSAGAPEPVLLAPPR